MQNVRRTQECLDVSRNWHAYFRWLANFFSTSGVLPVTVWRLVHSYSPPSSIFDENTNPAHYQVYDVLSPNNPWRVLPAWGEGQMFLTRETYWRSMQFTLVSDFTKCKFRDCNMYVRACFKPVTCPLCKSRPFRVYKKFKGV
uniref:Transposase n=1 Tax=viral metagenome TaxID=1070528 RepID=A0A6C0BNA0_9ZZZZ